MRTEWRRQDGLVDFEAAVAEMEARVGAIRAGRAPELVWLVEHPPLYTAGSSAHPSELLAPTRFPVYRTGRGGRFTYHGPGQRVIYLMLDIGQRGRDVRRFVRAIEAWLIAALAELGIAGERRDGRVGIWVAGPGGEDKIAAIGLRLRHWISYHGASINISPDLRHYDGIVPCGLRGRGVTSLAALGSPASMAEIDAALRRTFAPIFEAAGGHGPAGADPPQPPPETRGSNR